MINLLNFDRADLRDYFASIGEKPFRADQVMKWLYHYDQTDPAQMSNLSLKLRQTLSETTKVAPPDIQLEHISKDGTYKWVMRLEDGNSIETVYIPEKERGTLCVSSQVGCALKCTFCSTGTQGLNRNLTTAEIIGQVFIAQRQLKASGHRGNRPITNVVMMGMGEPLQNTEAVIKAMNIMLDDLGYGLSKYRVTLSTSGVVPEMAKLKERSNVALAVSLHAPNNELRNQLVPINKKYPLEALIEMCRHYFDGQSKRQITMEYVMLDGINDQPEHAKQLIKLLQGVPCKMNLIPFNTFPNTQYRCSSQKRIDDFRMQLIRGGLNTVTRKTRGDDIDGACGQLVGEVKKRERRSQRRIIPIHSEPQREAI